MVLICFIIYIISRSCVHVAENFTVDIRYLTPCEVSLFIFNNDLIQTSMKIATRIFYFESTMIYATSFPDLSMYSTKHTYIHSNVSLSVSIFHTLSSKEAFNITSSAKEISVIYLEISKKISKIISFSKFFFEFISKYP